MVVLAAAFIMLVQAATPAVWRFLSLRLSQSQTAAPLLAEVAEVAAAVQSIRVLLDGLVAVVAAANPVPQQIHRAA